MTTSRRTSQRIIFLLTTLIGFLVPQLSQAASEKSTALRKIAATSKAGKQKKAAARAEPLPEKKPAINENPLTAVANISPSRLSPGAQVKALIQLDLDSQYHAYKEKFSLRVLEPAGIVVSDFQVQPMVKFYDKLAKKEKEGLSEKGEVVATLMIPESLVSKPNTLVLELAYQACAEDHCLFPKRLKLDVPIEWVQKAAAPVMPTDAGDAADLAAAPVAPTTTGTKESGGFQGAMEKGAFFGFLFAFVAGLLTSLTPCVFPMIPITL
ncbi:MAG: protein-disulfide reductase DsbD N-terminal domain-containing protein, partial [Bdellovibrionales bacterium]|nr:protein-disulfide reductase DsbD N-terminal domain-containing protein [Bdellovibrionales bacterium]